VPGAFSVRCVHRGQGVSTVNCTSRPVPVTAAEIQAKENIPFWCFHLYFTQHKCLASDYEHIGTNHICENSRIPGMSWHGAPFLDLDCTVVHNLGLDIRITWGVFENPNTWPQPRILFIGISVGRGPGVNIF